MKILTEVFFFFETADTIDYMGRKNAKCYIITMVDGSEKEIKNLAAFCSDMDLNAGAMSQVAQGNLNQYKGYLCRSCSRSKKEWEASKTRGRKSGPGWKGDWLITKPDGTEHIITSLTAFCQENGLSQGNMVEVSLGRRKQHKGYLCRRVNVEKTQQGK